MVSYFELTVIFYRQDQFKDLAQGGLNDRLAL